MQNYIEGKPSKHPGIAILAAIQLSLGVFAVIAPHTFFELLADFGDYNRHMVQDLATIYLALGLGLTIATWRRPWRIPLLTVTALQNGLHTVNHLFDLDNAQPWWVGLFDLIGLLSLTGFCVWLGVREARAAWHRKLAFFRSRLRN